MEQQTVILLVVVALAALVIGLLIGRTMGGSSSVSTQKAQKELEDYKAAVSEHFGKTADLVDNLTSSYKDVFEHLGSSARQLLSEEEVTKHLQSRAAKAVTLTYMADKEKTEVKEKSAEKQSDKKAEKTVENKVAETEKKADEQASIKATTEKTDSKPVKTEEEKATAEKIAK